VSGRPPFAERRPRRATGGRRDARLPRIDRFFSKE
jgi:hypothetical protein